MNFLAGIIASVCFECAILFAGQATNVVKLPSASGRVSMSIGCYLYLAFAYLVEVKCNEYISKGWKRFLIITIGFVIAISPL